MKQTYRPERSYCPYHKNGSNKFDECSPDNKSGYTSIPCEQWRRKHHWTNLLANIYNNS
jgi:hypothetical protein